MVSVSLSTIMQPVTNFEMFEKVVDHALIANLLVRTKENAVLFSEPPVHFKEHRLKLTEFMFEKYQIPAMFICKNAVLSA
jgi:actin-like protein 6A